MKATGPLRVPLPWIEARRGADFMVLMGLRACFAFALLAVLPGVPPWRTECYCAAGQVEPLARVNVANRLTGVVSEVLFEGGETVTESTVLAKRPHDQREPSGG